MMEEFALDSGFGAFDPSGAVRPPERTYQSARPRNWKVTSSFDSVTPMRNLARELQRAQLSQERRPCSSCGSQPGQPLSPFHSPLPSSESPEIVPLNLTPNPLLELVAPHLGPLAVALEPLFTARGLSSASASIDDVLAIDGFIDELVDLAVEIIGPLGFVGYEGDAYQSESKMSPDVVVDDIAESSPPGWEIASSPSSPPVEGGVPGWKQPTERVFNLGRTLEGEPCYPDAPGWEEYFPKCKDPPLTYTVDCLLFSQFVKAEERLSSLRHFKRIPSLWGRDYRGKLEESVDVSDVYVCGGSLSSSSTLSSTFAQYIPASTTSTTTGTTTGTTTTATTGSSTASEQILIGDAFFNFKTWVDILGGGAFGPRDLRAGILLHEHVHRVDDLDYGVLFATSSISGTSCLTTEYNGAYIQAKYWAASDCVSNIAGRAYARNFCTPLLTGRQIASATFGDLDGCFSTALGVLGIIATVAALILTPAKVAASLLAALPGEVVILILYAILL
jgi:hypothetical protein